MNEQDRRDERTNDWQGMSPEEREDAVASAIKDILRGHGLNRPLSYIEKLERRVKELEAMIKHGY
jgi:chemotaxis methyl-accepting protein methylase